MAVTGKTPENLLTIQVDTAHGRTTSVHAKVIYESRRRIRRKPRPKICAGDRVQRDAVGWEIKSIANVQSSRMNYGSRPAAAFARAVVMPQRLAGGRHKCVRLRAGIRNKHRPAQNRRRAVVAVLYALSPQYIATRLIKRVDGSTAACSADENNSVHRRRRRTKRVLTQLYAPAWCTGRGVEGLHEPIVVYDKYFSGIICGIHKAKCASNRRRPDLLAGRFVKSYDRSSGIASSGNDHQSLRDQRIRDRLEASRSEIVLPFQGKRRHQGTGTVISVVHRTILVSDRNIRSRRNGGRRRYRGGWCRSRCGAGI